MSERSSEKSEMSALSEASELIQEVAGPAGSVKERIRRASRFLGFNYERAKSVWYQEARRIDAREMDSLREAARKLRQEDLERVAGEELRRLREEIASLRAAIAASGEKRQDVGR
jgi:hypothetical protein